MRNNNLKISDKVLAKAKLIQSKAAYLANDELSGEYTSAFKGRGIEFEEVREYREGDEVRDIDWKVTARFKKPFVKTFKDEREITIFFLIDVSKSTNFTTINKKKSEVIAEITALLSYASLRNKDKTGLIIFSDKVEHYIPPSRGQAHVWKIIRDILDFNPESSKTDINVGIDFLQKVRKKKAVVFVISDFLSEDFEKNLTLLSKMHELRLVSVKDPMESTIVNPPKGIFRFIDLETEELRVVDLQRRAKKDNIRDKMLDLSKRLGVWYLDVDSKTNYLDQIVKKLKRK